MKKKIFLIDDDKTVGLLLEAFLEKEPSLDLSFENNPVKAVEYLKQKDQCPDLILVDMRMPVMNGLEVLSILTTFEHLKSTTFSIFSTSVDPVDIERAKAFGAGYIEKNYDFALKRIKSALSGNKN